MTTQEVVVTVALIRTVLTEGLVKGGSGEPMPPGGPTPQRPGPDTGPPLPEPPKKPEEPQPIHKDPVDDPAIPPEFPNPIGDPPPDIPKTPGPSRNNPSIKTARRQKLERFWFFNESGNNSN